MFILRTQLSDELEEGPERAWVLLKWLTSLSSA